MDIRKLQRAIVDGLEDVKGHDIAVFNTEHLSPLFERVIIASGTSNRQTKALAASVRDAVKASGHGVLRTEGEANGEWIIVDCGAAVVHLMQPTIREYYHLEEIWGDKPVKMKIDTAPKRLVKAELADDDDGASAPRKAAKSAAAAGEATGRRPAQQAATLAAAPRKKAPAPRDREGSGRQRSATSRRAPSPPTGTGPKRVRASAGKTAARRRRRPRRCASSAPRKTRRARPRPRVCRAQSRAAQGGRHGHPHHRRQAAPAQKTGRRDVKLWLVAVGQRQPAWADAGLPRVRQAFSARAEAAAEGGQGRSPSGGKTAEQLMQAEAPRIEAASAQGRAPRRARRNRQPRHHAATQRAPAGLGWAAGRDVALLIGGPDGLADAINGAPTNGCACPT